MDNSVPLMNEEEFKVELDGSLVVLSTSSPDKRNIFREMFSSHDLTKDHDGHLKHGGINIFFTDSGAIKIPPRKTPEQTGNYTENLKEKYLQQIRVLQESEKSIRSQLVKKGDVEYFNNFNRKKINIIGMTEDSGWKIAFNDAKTEKQFLDKIIEKLKPKIRERDYWLIDKLHGEDKGFPGPNLKPFQEHLVSGFSEMMDMIYDTADEMGIKKLRFQNFSDVAFASPKTGKIFLKRNESFGDIITRDEYNEKMLSTTHGEAINSNFIHIPDGQKDGMRDTVDTLIKNGLHSKSSIELPANYARRDLTEYLQNLIGKRRTTQSERKRSVKISFVDSGYMDKGENTESASIPIVPDYKISNIPNTEKLRSKPHLKTFDDSDVVVLVPEKNNHTDYNLHDDPNFRLLTNFTTTIEVDPQSMNVPLVLDNRSGGWDKTLKLFTKEFAQGRIKGDRPFYVANTNEELENCLILLKDIKQRAPLIKISDIKNYKQEALPIKKTPNDGVFTLFIGGGHANNSKRDLEEAKEFGYYCAQQDWRIITGAGSLEGSMGGVHTGFIQYHLDILQEKEKLSAEDKKSLEKYKGKDGKYDAEDVIYHKPELLENLANNKLIPRNRFIGYSTKPLLEMESASGKAPPAITYIDAGNRVRRLDALLASGTKVFLPGSIGTDEEFAKSIEQRLNSSTGKYSNKKFSDGTPDDGGAIIIYNRNHHMDHLLAKYGLLDQDNGTRLRKKHNIILINDDIGLVKKSSSEVAKSWLERIQSNEQKGISTTII